MINKRDRIAIVISIVYFMLPLVVFFADRDGLITAPILLLPLIGYWGYRFIKNDRISITKDSIDSKDDVPSSSCEGDSVFYEMAEKEVDEENIIQGIWSQALVNAQGNEDLRKIEYMKIRVNQLKRNTQLQSTGSQATSDPFTISEVADPTNKKSGLLKKTMSIIFGLIILIVIGTAPAWIHIVTAMYNEYVLDIEPEDRYDATIMILKRINSDNTTQADFDRHKIEDALMACREYTGSNKELINLCKEAWSDTDHKNELSEVESLNLEEQQASERLKNRLKSAQERGIYTRKDLLRVYNVKNCPEIENNEVFQLCTDLE